MRLLRLILLGATLLVAIRATGDITNPFVLSRDIVASYVVYTQGYFKIDVNVPSGGSSDVTVDMGANPSYSDPGDADYCVTVGYAPFDSSDGTCYKVYPSSEMYPASADVFSTTLTSSSTVYILVTNAGTTHGAYFKVKASWTEHSPNPPSYTPPPTTLSQQSALTPTGTTKPLPSPPITPPPTHTGTIAGGVSGGAALACLGLMGAIYKYFKKKAYNEQQEEVVVDADAKPPAPKTVDHIESGSGSATNLSSDTETDAKGTLEMRAREKERELMSSEASHSESETASSTAMSPKTPAHL